MDAYVAEIEGLDEAYLGPEQSSGPDNITRVSELVRERTLYAVGSGGALAAAELAAFAHTTRTGRPASAVTPLAFIELGVVALDAVVIVFSSRAKHPDTALAIAHARGHGLTVVLVTQLKRIALAPALRDDHGVEVLNINAEFRDGFLATRSTMSMAVVIASIYGVELPSTPAHILLGRVQLRDRILVLYSAAGRAAAVDVETRLHELGLRDVQTTDYRNFAHGRHVGLHRRLESTTVIALADASAGALARKTLAAIPEGADVRSIESDQTGLIAAIELLLAVMPLPLLANESSKKDLSKPRVPAWGRRLYHLPYRRSFPPADLSPIQQKAVAGGFTLDNVDALNFYTSAFAAWRRRVQRTPVGCLVLDYDGTCVSTDGRFGLPVDDVKTALTGVLDRGLPIVFSTGRGDSLYRDLRAWVPKERWGQIHLELHQGAWPQELLDPLAEPDDDETWVTAATDRLAGFVAAGLLTLRRHGHQLSTQPGDGQLGIEALRRLVASALADIPEAVVCRSGHSVDVIHASVGKRRTAALASEKHGEVLAIGDQGAPGGNDFELLNRSHMTLSVDECSGAADRCWRLTKAHSSGPMALVDALARLTPRDGRMYLRV